MRRLSGRSSLRIGELVDYHSAHGILVIEIQNKVVLIVRILRIGNDGVLDCSFNELCYFLFADTPQRILLCVAF